MFAAVFLPFPCKQFFFSLREPRRESATFTTVCMKDSPAKPDVPSYLSARPIRRLLRGEGGEPKGWSEYLFLTFKQTVHSALVKCQSHPTDYIRGPPCTAVPAMNMPYRSRISDLCVQLFHLIFILLLLSADEHLRWAWAFKQNVLFVYF